MRPKLHIADIDESNEKLVAFAQTIDFSALFDHIKDFANIDCDFHQPAIITSGGGVHITFISDDIKSQTGPFAVILKRCYIQSFSNGVVKDKETGEPKYWVSVSIRYEHKDGGSNGMDMVRAWYKNGTWEFLNAGQTKVIKVGKYRIKSKSKGRGWLEGSINGFCFQAKVFDTGSKFGINNGRVSKLMVWEHRTSTDLFSYDRGWDAEPIDDEQKEVLQALLEHLENMPAEGW
jgi:hypothetical protein